MRTFRALAASIAVGIALLGATGADPAHADATEEGFTSLFNGVDLTGWTGAKIGYRAQDGMLVADKPLGNLYTNAEFSDFILRFEFKLTPGANNGIGLRVPMNRRASREGMEIQIFDDSAAKAQKAHPWQMQGSIYGVVPAKTGHLKPVGEWNEEEIRAQGAHIVVILNGATIVDADLTPFRNGAPTPDGRRHPGLNQIRGHISLCGHQSLVYFRNLRVKSLKSAAPNKWPSGIVFHSGPDRPSSR